MCKPVAMWLCMHQLLDSSVTSVFVFRFNSVPVFRLLQFVFSLIKHSRAYALCVCVCVSVCKCVCVCVCVSVCKCV